VEHFWADSLPRDSVVNTLHFNDAGIDTDPQGLAEDLLAGLAAIPILQSRGLRVKFYDLADALPRPIKGQAENTTTSNLSALGNREVALCLSYYSERNLPRQRGRIYVGPFSAAEAGSRTPAAPIRAAVASLVPVFTNLGGSDVDWCVYSRTDGVMRPITNWWIDDAWDTQRRRGLRATTRDTGTTTEL
jgi:hypothetical protein